MPINGGTKPPAATRARKPPLPARFWVFKPHGSMTSGPPRRCHGTAPRRAKSRLPSQIGCRMRIEHDQPIIDVSADNDWTEVRVWYEPTHAMGRTIYPTYGFILPQ